MLNVVDSFSDTISINAKQRFGACSSSAIVATSWYTTDEVASLLKIESQSIRKRYSQTGSYYGLKPHKLPNRRLMWSAQELENFCKEDLEVGYDE